MSERLYNLHDLVILMTVVQCLMLTLYQAIQSNAKPEARWYLGSFLLSVAASAFSILLLWNPVLSLPPKLDTVWLPFIVTMSFYLRGPLLYLYAQTVITRGAITLQQAVPHFVGILIIFTVISAYSITSSQMRMESNTDDIQMINNVIWDFLKFVPIGYSLATFYLLRRYKASLGDNYSHYTTREINWLTTMTIGFFITWCWSAGVHLIGKYTDIDRGLVGHWGVLENYLTFILINTLSVYSLALADKLLPLSALKKRPEHNDNKYYEDAQAAVDDILKAMEVDTLYLKANLNIEQLSEHIDLPVKVVSTAINQHFQKNFFEFVNGYRLRVAKEKLSDPALKDTPILDILLAAGFNSTSSFHRHFKKATGTSPSEWRKSKIQD